jgi:hypothetical protein
MSKPNNKTLTADSIIEQPHPLAFDVAVTDLVAVSDNAALKKRPFVSSTYPD